MKRFILTLVAALVAFASSGIAQDQAPAAPARECIPMHDCVVKKIPQIDNKITQVDAVAQSVAAACSAEVEACLQETIERTQSKDPFLKGRPVSETAMEKMHDQALDLIKNLILAYRFASTH